VHFTEHENINFFETKRYIFLFKCYCMLAWRRPYKVETCSYNNSASGLFCQRFYFTY